MKKRNMASKNREHSAIEFNNPDSSISIGIHKDSKITVCAKWDEWCGETTEESTRGIPIKEVFDFLISRDKYINEKAKEISGKEIAELRKMYEVKTKELREANFNITRLEDKVKSYKTVMKEMKAK